MSVERLLSPLGLCHPAVARLFWDVLPEQPPAKRPAIIEAAAAELGSPATACFLGIEEGEPRAMTYLTLPSPQQPWLPPILHLAINKGSRALGAEVIAATVEFCKAHGYNTAWTCNRSGHSDAAWERMARLRWKDVTKAFTTYRVEF